VQRTVNVLLSVLQANPNEGATIMDISRAAAKAITTEIDTAVKAILDKHGLTAGQVKTNYGYQYKYTITASIPVVNDDGFDIGTPEAQMFLICAQSHGFPNPQDTLGKEFTANGKRFIVTGYNSRAPKFPFLGKNLADGSGVKFPTSWAKHFPGYDRTCDMHLPFSQRVLTPDAQRNLNAELNAADRGM
jgi:hypothetical protein